jgi:archaemetzincin
MTVQSIKLLNLGNFDKELLHDIGVAVGQTFQLPVEFSDEYIDLSPFFDSARKQYNGNELIKKIRAKAGSNDTKTIGLFEVDLFIPILTYIFGQAYLNGNIAIASSHRLGNERYGLEINPFLFQQRFIKEINHELGHCFGLVHCHQPGCVMQSSTYVEDIDQKGIGFCSTCQEILK